MGAKPPMPLSLRRAAGDAAIPASLRGATGEVDSARWLDYGMVYVIVSGWKNKRYFGDNLDILREHVASEAIAQPADL